MADIKLERCNHGKLLSEPCQACSDYNAKFPPQPSDNANGHQVGGTHYAGQMQHWDYVVANGLNYFEGQITKYVTRCRKKNGLEDLKKARHFLDKYIEEAEAGRISL